MNILWPGQIRHFAVSSGTASAGKILPVSDEMLKANRRFSVMVGLHYLINSGNPRFFFGKHLTLPGRIEEDPHFPGTSIGEISGFQAEYAPSFFKHFLQAVPNSVSFLPGWENKLDAIASQTFDRDIRLLVMAPTWATVLFRRLIAMYNSKHGTRVSTIGEIWPHLQAFVSGGVALTSYKTLLEDIIGLPNLNFVETYGASEGFFSFQNDLQDPAMVMHMNGGVFYEFVKLDELGQSNPRRYTVSDIETGVRYALVVSTCSGLWSYEVGDVIRFTETFPHKIRVAGRTAEMIDKYGEAIFVDEAQEALQRACEKTGSSVREFHIAPLLDSGSHIPTHQWLIEFEKPPENLTLFSRLIDQHIAGINRHYQIRRDAGAFGLPDIVLLPTGTFYLWLERTKKEISGQTKVPRMSEERSIAESVLQIAGNNSELST